VATAVSIIFQISIDTATNAALRALGKKKTLNHSINSKSKETVKQAGHREKP
jgi:hypothetical protein